jgi:hypothetical protein
LHVFLGRRVRSGVPQMCLRILHRPHPLRLARHPFTTISEMELAAAVHVLRPIANRRSMECARLSPAGSAMAGETGEERGCSTANCGRS